MFSTSYEFCWVSQAACLLVICSHIFCEICLYCISFQLTFWLCLALLLSFIHPLKHGRIE